MRHGVTMILFALATGTVFLVSSLALTLEWGVAATMAGANINQLKLQAAINAFRQSSVVACAAGVDELLTNGSQAPALSVESILSDSCKASVASMNFKIDSVEVSGGVDSVFFAPHDGGLAEISIVLSVDASDQEGDHASQTGIVSFVCPMPLPQVTDKVEESVSVLRVLASSFNSGSSLPSYLNYTTSLPSAGVVLRQVVVQHPSFLYYRVTANVTGHYCAQPGSWRITLIESGQIPLISGDAMPNRVEAVAQSTPILPPLTFSFRTIRL